MSRFIFYIIFLLLPISAASQTLEQGIALFEQENYDQAETIFQKLLDSDSKNASAQFYLGRIAFEKEDHDKALKLFEKASEIESDSPVYTMWIGNAYGRKAQKASVLRQAGYAKKCIAHYEKAIELDPDFIPARFRAIDYYVEAPGFVGGGRDKAEAQVLEIETIDPKEAYMAKGIIYSFFNEDDKLIENYESAISTYPEFMPPYFELFEYYYGHKKYEEAASLARAQLSVNDSTAIIRENLNRALEHLE